MSVIDICVDSKMTKSLIALLPFLILIFIVPVSGVPCELPPGRLKEKCEDNCVRVCKLQPNLAKPGFCRQGLCVCTLECAKDCRLADGSIYCALP